MAFDLFVEALDGVGWPDLPPVFGREPAEREQVAAGVVEHLGCFGVGAFEHAGHLVELRLNVLGVGRGEDGADGLLQTGVRVGDDEVDTVEAADFQRPEEAGLEHLGLAVTSGEAEDLAASIGGTPMATIVAWEMTRWLTRASQSVVSRNTQGYPVT